MSLFDPVLDLLFPKFCLGCGLWGVYLCSQCAQQISFYDFPVCPGCMKKIATCTTHATCQKSTALDGLLVMATFTGVLKQMIAEMKYLGYFDETETLVRILKYWLGRQKAWDRIRPSALIPIPLHKERLEARGFNQSELVVKRLSVLLGTPTTNRALVKTKPSAPQAELKRSERLHNVQNSFSCPLRLRKTDTIVLVDDVVTTGTTLSACAQVLKQAGAGKVYGLAIAHGH